MKSIFPLLLIIFNYTVFAQSKTATPCGAYCPRLTTHVTKKTDYGVPNSSLFEITNNGTGAVKVSLYIKTKDGDVLGQGISDPIEKDKSFTFHYNIDNVADYCVYYIEYPSDEKFPLLSEVKRRMIY